MGACSWGKRTTSKEFRRPWAAEHAAEQLRVFELCFAKLLIDLAEALSVLHRGGFSHNDLHEGNVLVSLTDTNGRPHGSVGICDWGRATSVRDRMRLGFAIRGKTGRDYIAPEHVLPCTGPTTKGDVLAPTTDIYSFGFLMKLVFQNREDRVPKAWFDIAGRCQANAKYERPSMQEVVVQLKASM